MRLLAAVGTIAPLGCVVPPDGTGAGRANSPPEVALDSVFPGQSILTVRPNCDFRPELEVRDKDDEALIFRFVANNAVPDTRLIREGFVEMDPGSTRFISERVIMDEIFPTLALRLEQPGVEIQVGTLSVFVTDAPEWENEAPEPGTIFPQGEDFGRIVNPVSPNGFEPYNVVEIRWTVVLSNQTEACL